MNSWVNLKSTITWWMRWAHYFLSAEECSTLSLWCSRIGKSTQSRDTQTKFKIFLVVLVLSRIQVLWQAALQVLAKYQTKRAEWMELKLRSISIITKLKSIFRWRTLKTVHIFYRSQTQSSTQLTVNTRLTKNSNRNKWLTTRAAAQINLKILNLKKAIQSLMKTLDYYKNMLKCVVKETNWSKMKVEVHTLKKVCLTVATLINWTK